MKIEVHHYHHDPDMAAALRMLRMILQNTETIMSQDEDLIAAVGDLKSAVSDSLSAMDKLLTDIANKTGNDPAVGQSITDIKGLSEAIRAELAKVNAPPAA